LYAFDILVHRGRNVLRLPIEERRELLTEALRKVQYPVIQSVPFDVKPAELLRAAEALEFEGVIAKRNGSNLRAGTGSGAWLKYKINCSQEFVIGGYTLGGNPFDALIVGCYDGMKLKYVAKVREPVSCRTCVAPFTRCCRSFAQRNARLPIYQKSAEHFIRSPVTRCKTANG